MVDFASQLQLPDYSRLAGGVQGLIGLQGNLLQQQQLQQQMDANIAASEAMKRATDPVTGKLDQSKFAALMSQGPGAYNLPTYLKNATELENLQLETQAKRFDLQQKQLGFWNGQLGALMSKGRNVSTKDVLQSLSNGLALGMITPDQAKQYADAIPSSPDERAEWIKQHWIGLQSAKDQANVLIPNVQAVDSGGATQMIPLDPLTGQVKGGVTVVPKTLSPGELAQNVTVIGPKGEQRVITKEQQLAQLGGAGQNAGSAGGYTGRYATNQAALGAGGISGVGLQASLAPGEAEAMQAVGKGSGDQYVADSAAANRSGERLFQLDKALQALQGATTGRGSEALNNFKSYLQTVGIPGLDVDKIKDYDEASKYLTQYATGQASKFGSGTDQQLAATLSGNASTGISNLAAQDVVKANIGLELMRQAQLQAFNESGLTPAQYQKFSTQWNKEQDPRVFIWDILSKDQKQKAFDSMSEGKRKQFSERYNAAYRNGWLRRPE